MDKNEKWLAMSERRWTMNEIEDAFSFTKNDDLESLRREFKYLPEPEGELSKSTLRKRLKKMEKIAEDWMKECDALRAKYEPEYAVLSEASENEPNGIIDKATRLTAPILRSMISRTEAYEACIEMADWVLKQNPKVNLALKHTTKSDSVKIPKGNPFYEQAMESSRRDNMRVLALAAERDQLKSELASLKTKLGEFDEEAARFGFKDYTGPAAYETDELAFDRAIWMKACRWQWERMREPPAVCVCDNTGYCWTENRTFPCPRCNSK